MACKWLRLSLDFFSLQILYLIMKCPFCRHHTKNLLVLCVITGLWAMWLLVVLGKKIILSSPISLQCNRDFQIKIQNSFTFAWRSMKCLWFVESWIFTRKFKNLGDFLGIPRRMLCNSHYLLGWKKNVFEQKPVHHHHHQSTASQIS